MVGGRVEVLRGGASVVTYGATMTKTAPVDDAESYEAALMAAMQAAKAAAVYAQEESLAKDVTNLLMAIQPLERVLLRVQQARLSKEAEGRRGDKPTTDAK